MKAISLWQPWATAMAIGLKTIETRHWSTNIRGLVAIHASKQWQISERRWAAELAELHNAPAIANPPLGKIVATGRLVAVKRTEDLLPTISETEETFGNYAPQRFGWLFEEIVALPIPVPIKGAQGFFDIPEELLAMAANMTAEGFNPRDQPDLFAANL